MTIERRTRLYEILLRFDADGYKASHVIDLQEVYDTENGEVIAATELPARPITKKEVGSLLGAAVAGNVEKINALVARRTEAIDTARLEMAAEAEAARAEAAARTEERNQAVKEAAVSAAAVSVAGERLAALEALLARARQETAEAIDAHRDAESRCAQAEATIASVAKIIVPAEAASQP